MSMKSYTTGMTIRPLDGIAGGLTPVLARILLLSLFFLLTVPETGGAALRIGDTVQPIVLASVNGSPVRIPESFRGKVVIVHFWQIGCSSCRLDMPLMDDLYAKYRKKGLEIVAINLGQQKETVKSFAAGLKVSYPILVDTDARSTSLYGVTDVPRTYVIDRSGTLRYRILGGAVPDMLKKLILSLL